MLHDFIAANREELIRRCRGKVETRSVPPPTAGELDHGVPKFLGQLVDALHTRRRHTHLDIDTSAAHHGRDLQEHGFTLSQVVHDYGDVCQSITDLAVVKGEPISVEEFRTLNQCLDDAIASAVTAHGQQDPLSKGEDGAAEARERFGFFAHEIRNLVNTSSLAFEVLDTGDVGVKGSTGRVLKRSLSALRDLVNRSVTEVRLHSIVQGRVDIVVADLVEELAPSAALEAAARGLRLTVDGGETGLAVHADSLILTAVVMNLLHNAFKFTRPETTVALRVAGRDDRVLIEIADECGGLSDGDVDDLFRPFEQRNVDRTGLGLGLSFSRWGAEVNGGLVSVRNLAGHGCVFTVSLPRTPARATA